MSGKPNDFVLGEGETRLTCGLPGATSELLQAYQKGYRPNENPALCSVRRVDGSKETTISPDDGTAADCGDTAAKGEALTIARGGEIKLRASWVGCPKPDMNCSATSA